MVIEYTLDQKDTYIHIVAKGEVSEAQELLDYVDALVADCDKAGSRQLLLDHRAIEMPEGRAVTYETAASSIDKLSSDKPFQVALVARPERMEFARVYESIGINRGLELKAFDEVHIAAAWLNL